MVCNGVLLDVSLEPVGDGLGDVGLVVTDGLVSDFVFDLRCVTLSVERQSSSSLYVALEVTDDRDLSALNSNEINLNDYLSILRIFLNNEYLSVASNSLSDEPLPEAVVMHDLSDDPFSVLVEVGDNDTGETYVFECDHNGEIGDEGVCSNQRFYVMC